MKHVGWKHSAGTRYVLFLCLAVLFYVSLAPNLLPERYNIHVGARSEKEIRAPMQIPNNKATLKAQEQEAERVQPIYTIVTVPNENLVVSILDRIDRLNQDDQVSREDKIAIYKLEIPQRAKDFIQNFVNANTVVGELLGQAAG